MAKVSLQTLGRLVIEKRGGLGIRAAATEVGVSAATLSRVERGYLPDLDTFSKICSWLGLNPGDVLGTRPPAHQPGTPQVAVHFKKDAAVAPTTAHARAQMVLAANRAWLASDDERG